MERLTFYESNSTETDSYRQHQLGLLFIVEVHQDCFEHKTYCALDVVLIYIPQSKAYVFLIIYFDVYEDRRCIFHAREDADLPDVVKQNIEYTDLTESLSMYLIDIVLLLKKEY